MSTYAYQILEGIKDHYEISQIMDISGDVLDGCQTIIPKTLPIPYNYLTWSLSTSFQKRIFSNFDIIHNIGQY
ncbi:MAG: hypothetical protein CVV33_07985, partial [Methanomicrobiales archaeon HGW-Methanomicrobiales-4]